MREPPDAPARLYEASLSTMWGIKKFSEFGDFFPACRALGFLGVELNHQVNPAMLSGIDLRSQRITSIHEPCPAAVPATALKVQDCVISSLDEERRREGINAIKRSLDLARELGTRAVVIHAGQVRADGSAENEMRLLFDRGQAGSPKYLEIRERFVRLRAKSIGAHLEAVKRSMLELLEYAGEFPLCLGIENRYHYLDIPGPDELAEILDLAEPERIGFVYDVGHAQALDKLGFYPHETWLKRHAGRIVGTHLHDARGISDHRAPGLGEVDFRKVASYLPRAAFRTLEIQGFNTPEQIEAGMNLLADTGCVNLIQ